MKTYRTILFFLFLLLLVLAGCITPLMMYRYRDLYRGPVEELGEGVDTTGLKGRVIVLDPGHGGPALGAVGPKGLTEKEVNLSVAQHLREMLTSYGAHVVLTREGDTRAVQDPKAGNRADLEARVRISNEVKADLFISLHHNADAIPGSKKNEVETYYAIEGGNASYGLAKCIHRHLVRRLGIKENRIIPGNFAVLRGNEAISVLLEPSYLTHEFVEYRLRSEEARRLEATAIFMGIAEYLSKGLPQLARISPNNETISTAFPQITFEFKDDPLGKGIDPSTIRMELNGKVVRCYFKKKEGVAIFTPRHPLENGPHSINIQAKNYNGNILKPKRAHFIVDLPPKTIGFLPALSQIPPDCLLPIGLEISLRDRYGHLVNDGWEVNIEVDKGVVYPTVDKTKDGRVIAYVRPSEGDHLITVSCGLTKERFVWSSSKTKEKITVLYLKDKVTGSPIEEARLISSEDLYSFNRDGYLLIEDPPPKGTVWAKGYSPYPLDLSSNDEFSELEIFLEPAFNGILFNKVVAIDPDFGGLESGAVTTDGIREADLNLEVAKFLARYLEEAGAQPILTRESDTTLTSFERLLKIERSGADILVIIGHNQSDLTYTQYYPGSKRGRLLATSLHRFIKRGIKDGGVIPIRRYLITHTSMPAVYVHPSGLKDLDPVCLRLEAYSIFSGLLGYYLGGGEDGFFEISGFVKDREGRPMENVIVILNGIFQTQTTRDGGYRLYLPKMDSVTYRLHFARAGFTPKEIDLKELESGKMDIVLE
ncbi:TPA: hypothetical protein DCX15_01180 [bacterium]|nr:hypothetical protein [bacterium]